MVATGCWGSMQPKIDGSSTEATRSPAGLMSNSVPKLPRAIVFDMDGLLFDSEALYRDAFVAAAAALGHAFTVDHFLGLVGRSWSLNRISLQNLLGPGSDADAYKAVWLSHFDNMKANLALKVGAMELLDYLDELRLPRVICTSSSHEDVSHNLVLHGLVDRFNGVIAAGDYAQGKPSPDPYLRAAEFLGVDPADCLALEDSHNGVRSAAAAGLRTIMVPDLLPATDEIRNLCELVALDLYEIVALLRSCDPPPAPTPPSSSDGTD